MITVLCQRFDPASVPFVSRWQRLVANVNSRIQFAVCCHALQALHTRQQPASPHPHQAGLCPLSILGGSCGWVELWQADLAAGTQGRAARWGANSRGSSTFVFRALLIAFWQRREPAFSHAAPMRQILIFEALTQKPGPFI